MNRFTLVAAALAGALLLPAAAAAKGPSQASISGGSLGKTIKLGGNGELEGTPLGSLTAEAGFFPAAFGQSPNPMLPGRPSGDLGPKLTIHYVVPGPNDATFRITQDVYPYARNGAVTYMKPGQLFFGREHTRGGWYRGSSALKTLLVKEGLPAQAPAVTPRASRARFPSKAVAIGSAIAVVLGLIGASSIARWRPNRSTSDTREPPG